MLVRARRAQWPSGRREWCCAGALTVAVLAALVIPAGASATAPACPENTPSTASYRLVTCSFTGADQSFTVPTGATHAVFDVVGAEGGAVFAHGGQGGRARADLLVTAGSVLRIVVGQSGSRGMFGSCDNVIPATYGGGGGSNGTGTSGCAGYAGGGGSFVFDGAQELIVAGGGGGGRAATGETPGAGGGLAGGDASRAGAIGGRGGVTSGTTGTGGAGADGSAGGAPANPGSRGLGGFGVAATSYAGSGGGGGGGFYGGGGGTGGCCDQDNMGAGGGGSGYIHAAARSDTSYTPAASCGAVTSKPDCQNTGGNAAHGSITITFRTGPSSTSTAVSCTRVAEDATSTCTATVTDADGGLKVTPTGTASFSVAPSGGTFGATSCTLAESSTGVAKCSVTYAPPGPASPDMTASYGGDGVHTSSSGSSTVTVARRTTTALSCPDAIFGDATTCTVTVADETSGATGAATGNVTFTSGDTSATFAPSNRTCTLASSGGTTSTCTIAFSASQPGTPTVTATYAGDNTHATSTNGDTPDVSKRTTATSVSCPTAVDGGTTTCTATVGDTSTAASARPPAGTVTFGDGGAGGSFASASCTLSGSGGQSSCTAVYTPSQPGTPHVTATYATGLIHTGSSGGADVTVLRMTSTALDCPRIVNGETTTCTATVRDASTQGTATAPSGQVTFSGPAGGSFGSGTNCTLVAGDASASCSISYTPSGAGTPRVTATYPGDSTHGGSDQRTDVTVLRTTAATVSCADGAIEGRSTLCTVSISDDDASAGPTAPTGTVRFSDGAANGSFDDATCTISGGTPATCSVGYTPESTDTRTLTASYDGDATHASSDASTDVTAAPDGDRDGVVDADDDCPTVANADQGDLDNDDQGDACDDDQDGDGVENADDGFPRDRSRTRRPPPPAAPASATPAALTAPAPAAIVPPDRGVLGMLHTFRFSAGKGILAQGLQFEQDVPAGTAEWRLQLTVWREPSATAKTAAVRRPVTLAVVRRTIATAGTQRVSIRVRSARARHLLRTRPRAKVVIRSAVTIAGGRRVLAAGTIVPARVVNGSRR